MCKLYITTIDNDHYQLIAVLSTGVTVRVLPGCRLGDH